MIDLTKIKKIYFVGIGGIGVSALARMVIALAKKTGLDIKINGSDQTATALTYALQKESIKIHIGHSKKNLPNDTDLVVYSAAVPHNNPELALARERKIPTMTRSQFLGALSKNYTAIAVSGTHGKTTTTAMLGEILAHTNKSPTIVVGSLLIESGVNFVAGDGEYLVVEACEYQRSFLDLSPKILLITNIEEDHLDYYKDLKDIQNAFADLAAKLPADGALVCDTSDKNLKRIIKKTGCRVINYKKEKMDDLKLRLHGNHNISNAQAALAAARVLGVERETAIKALNDFAGTARRMEYKGVAKSGAAVYDDYAHHPTEIRASLSGARELIKKNKKMLPNSKVAAAHSGRLIVIFQPHLFSRTKQLFDQFAKSFAEADEIIITDIYAAREKNEKIIHSKDLVRAIKYLNQKPQVYYMHIFEDIASYLLYSTSEEDTIVIIGAGDIYKVAEMLLQSCY